MSNIPFIALIVDSDVASNGVTAAYLAAHGDTLPAWIPQLLPAFVSVGDTLMCAIDGDDLSEMTRSVEPDDFAGQVEVRFPGHAFRAVAPGGHVITYRCETPDGTLIGTSQATEIDVDLAPELDLPAPGVANAPVGRLDPFDALDGTEVSVRFNDMSAGQRIQAHWHGERGDSSLDTPWVSVPSPVPDFVFFEIPPFLVAGNVDATVSVSYSVDHDDVIATSAILSLTILPFALSHMPTPQLPQLGGGNRIEPVQLPDGLTVVLPAWYLAFEGQVLWLRCYGESADSPGQPYEHRLRWAHAISSAEAVEGVSSTVPASWLTPLLHGSRLYFEYEVAYHDGGRQGANRLSFEVFNP